MEDLPQRGRAALLEKSLDEAERVMAQCDRLGVRILTFGDADYPERLKNIYDPPVVLYVKERQSIAEYKTKICEVSLLQLSGQILSYYLSDGREKQE